MAEHDKFEMFMQRILLKPMPINQMARIRTFAKELAEGAIENLWKPRIEYYEFREPQMIPDVGVSGLPDGEKVHPSHDKTNVTNYVERRWGFDNVPNLDLLVANEYCSEYTSSGGFFISHTLELTRLAFELLHELESSTVFISYKRSESSAFALLINASLKAEGINSYLDMAIPKGDDWQERIKNEIERHDYFVFLLNSQTLDSNVVRQEIAWAVQFRKTVIPIWHYGYSYESGKFPVLLEVDEMLKKTNAIRVLEESALAYNNAIVELLNRFGVTP